MKHKHAELIKAWADGAQIQVKDKQTGRWDDLCCTPSWRNDFEYRIKPEEKKPVVRWLWTEKRKSGWVLSAYFATEEEVKSFASLDKWTKLDWSRTEFEE